MGVQLLFPDFLCVHIVYPNRNIPLLQVGVVYLILLRWVAENGAVADFVMNDKCAAGTGRFLQVMTGILDITLAELGQMAIKAEPVSINSMCTVFAESEIIGLLAQGVPKEAIAAGIVNTIANKLASLTSRVSCKSEVTFSGGVANNVEICQMLSAALGVEFNVPWQPQIVGALGAAIIAYRQ